MNEQPPQAPKVDDKVVYIAGSWDMFHAGHIEALEKAKKLGTYVIVGIHNDQVVNKLQGMNLPIMSLHERTLSVLGCKWVDDVLIDAPYVITQEMMSSLRISIVAQSFPEVAKAEVLNQAPPMNDPYALPRQLGILQTIFTEYNLSGEVPRVYFPPDKLFCFSRSYSSAGLCGANSIAKRSLCREVCTQDASRE